MGRTVKFCHYCNLGVSHHCGAVARFYLGLRAGHQVSALGNRCCALVMGFGVE